MTGSLALLEPRFRSS